MVRFHWHVEHGLSAYCPREPAVVAEGGVRHVEAEAEISGQKETLPMVFTTPPNCFTGGPVKEIGVVLAHSDAVQWKGRLLTELAVALAASGGSAISRTVVILRPLPPGSAAVTAPCNP